LAREFVKPGENGQQIGFWIGGGHGLHLLVQFQKSFEYGMFGLTHPGYLTLVCDLLKTKLMGDLGGWVAVRARGASTQRNTGINHGFIL
jgi:hypothetical protein